MVNPNFSGLFSGFKIEVMSGDSSIVSEKVEFLGNVNILTGLLAVSYQSDNTFKWAKEAKYALLINLVNKVDSFGKLYITLSNAWTFNFKTCTLVSGFIPKATGEAITCKYVENMYQFVIENFESISSE